MSEESGEEKLEDGIYIIKPGKEWLVVANGEENRFKGPDYDLEYLIRGQRGRTPFRGDISGDRKQKDPTSKELTEHFPEEFQETARRLGFGQGRFRK